MALLSRCEILIGSSISVARRLNNMQSKLWNAINILADSVCFTKHWSYTLFLFPFLICALGHSNSNRILTSSHWKSYYNALFIFKLNQLLTNRITAPATTEKVGRDHVMATTDITQSRGQNDSMNEVAMGAIGTTVVHDFWQGWRSLAVRMASCDSPCVKLATYKFSLRGEL